jgi:hypothetical protein
MCEKQKQNKTNKPSCKTMDDFAGVSTRASKGKPKSESIYALLTIKLFLYNFLNTKCSVTLLKETLLLLVFAANRMFLQVGCRQKCYWVRILPTFVCGLLHKPCDSGLHFLRSKV